MRNLFYLLALACLLAGGRTDAQPSQPTSQEDFVKVGVYVNPPFVLKEGDGYSGMAVELWQKVAADLAVVSKYEEFRERY